MSNEVPKAMSLVSTEGEISPVDVKKNRKVTEKRGGFTTYQIQKLRELFVGNLAQVVTEESQPDFTDQAIALIHLYETEFDEQMINRSKDVAFVRKHQAFIDAYNTVKDEVIEATNYFDRRVLASEGVALHYLFVADKVQTLYSNYLKLQHGGEAQYLQHRLDESGFTSVSDEQLVLWKQEAEVEAVTNYLLTLAAKNKESHTNSEAPTVTVGMEWEYDDPANMYSALLFDQEMNSVPTDIHQVYMKRALVEQNATIPGQLAQFGAYEDTYDLQEHALESREVVTKPTRGYRAPIRELLYTQKHGGLVGELSPHETFVGVELSRNHTEVMDVRAVLTAAGYIYPPAPANAEVVEWATDVVEGRINEAGVESEPKPSVTADNELLCFPNFRTRDRNKIQKTREEEISAEGVEWRGFPGLARTSSEDIEEKQRKAWEDFFRYVRKVRHQWLSTIAIAAVQKTSEKRNSTEIKLVEAWDDYLEQWQQLIIQFNLRNVIGEGRFEEVVATEDMKELLKRNPYNLFLDTLDATAQLNPNFMAEARKIIRNFNRRVQELIK